MIGEMKKLILCLLFLIVGVELHASSAHGDSLRIMSYNIHNGCTLQIYTPHFYVI